MESLSGYLWLGLSFQLWTSADDGSMNCNPVSLQMGMNFFHTNVLNQKLTFKYSTATLPLHVSGELMNFRVFPPLVITTIPKSNCMF